MQDEQHETQPLHHLDIKATIPAESEAAEASRATIRTNDAALQVSMDAASDADALKALMPAGE